MAAIDTISQVLDAAGEVFAEKGFQHATVREICARAGVNIAAVNYHFGDKERLYVEAVKSARHVIESNAPMPADMETAEPEVALRVFIHTLAQRLLRDGNSWRHRLLVQEFMNPSRACEEMMQESICPTMERLHQIIRRMLPANAPPHVIRQLGFSIISQCAYYRLQERVVAMLTPEDEFSTHFTPELLADHITRFCVAAIRSYELPTSNCQNQVPQ